MKTWKIAIIGAGAAGLCAARHIASKPNMTPVVFEKAKTVGGVWCYTDQTDRDQYGLKIHSAMYKNLKTNLPKEVMEFQDFPFHSDYPSFLTHDLVEKYLSSYCSHYNLDQFIKFESLVRHVKPVLSDEATVWEVTVEDLKIRSSSTVKFDAIFVCNGHYATPYLPVFPGQSNFKGTIMHSHSYRRPERYGGKRVLILGCKSSGKDIALDIAKHAESVVISHRTELISCPIPGNVSQVSSIVSFKDDGVTVCFENGSESEFDDAIYCTGYKYYFPFLDTLCDISVDGGRICHLYKHMVNPSYPSMMFIGICSLINPFPQFHLQVLYCLAALEGSLQLPSKEDMLVEIDDDYQDRLKRDIPHRKAHMLGPGQWNYNNMLADAAGSPRLHPRVEQLYKDVDKSRKSNLCHYREEKITTLESGFYQLHRN